MQLLPVQPPGEMCQGTGCTHLDSSEWRTWREATRRVRCVDFNAGCLSGHQQRNSGKTQITTVFIPAKVKSMQRLPGDLHMGVHTDCTETEEKELLTLLLTRAK